MKSIKKKTQGNKFEKESTGTSHHGINGYLIGGSQFPSLLNVWIHQSFKVGTAGAN